MYKLYHKIMSLSEGVLKSLLMRRMRKGKEDISRLHERMGEPDEKRPDGNIIWVHAASVGEAQSALILIERILREYEAAYILITTGTKSSAGYLEKKLPKRAIHQYIPLDHPKWAAGFLDHWRPSLALWMESELWPNILSEMKARKIPAALVNARLSKRSFTRWKWLGGAAKKLLSCFDIILTQTTRDEEYYRQLGAENVVTTDNLKFSAHALPADEGDLKALRDAAMNRPLWLYASTHDGEEQMACRLHEALKTTFPELLTIIVPRHPERREDIINTIENHKLACTIRGEQKNLPQNEDDIYLADTFGELGLFYRLAPLACIGRSFSRDGGGGHNPIEAAQLHCAVLHGPHVKYQQDIFNEMNTAGAALLLPDEGHFSEALETLLHDESALKTLQEKGAEFASAKTAVIDKVMPPIKKLLTQKGIAA